MADSTRRMRKISTGDFVALLCLGVFLVFLGVVTLYFSIYQMRVSLSAPVVTSSTVVVILGIGVLIGTILVHSMVAKTR